MKTFFNKPAQPKCDFLKSFAIALALMLGSSCLNAQSNVVPDDQEFQALKALYDSLGGANWTIKTNWPTSGNWPATATAAQMATWSGVTVANGDITRIVLVANNLVGKIPSNIGNLKMMNYISLSRNVGITGAIPASLGTLTNIQQIYLYQNALTGAIPSSLFNLPSLTILSLLSNKLSGPIPDNIGNATNLTSLSLSQNKLTSSIPTSIINLTHLNVLDLSQNTLTGPIPTPIGSMTLLLTLALNTNQLSGVIPSSVNNLVNLTNLSIGTNNFTGDIPDFSNLTKLTTLSIAYCPNFNPGPIPQIFNNTQLTSLSLQSCNRNGAISSAIGNLTKLTNLYLNNNQLTGSIPASIGNLSDMYDLELQYNNLSGSIPSSIGNLIKVRIFYMYNNKLSGELPSSMGNLVSIGSLRLENNQLTGLLPDFSKLTVMSQLILVNNQLSGQIVMANFAAAMVDFQIGGNKFSGAFPSINKWSNISGIVIGGNQFSGDFPSVTSLPKLDYISAGSCRFTSIPSSLLSISKKAHGYVYLAFDDNLITAITNLAADIAGNNIHPDATITLKLANNKLDFSQIESLMNLGIPTLTYSPQKTISDTPTQSVTVGTDFILTARPKGSFTSNMKWEKQQSNGTWQDITSSNADPLTGNTYRVVNATGGSEGNYRWSCTSTKATGFTLSSDPIVVKTPNRLTMDNFGFQYKYDGRRRMIQKKVPGADWVYMVYDNRDRLVLTQDGNQRLANKWTFTKYDGLNRPIMTGVYTHTVYLDQAGMSALISTTNFYETYTGLAADAGTHGYSNTVFPIDLTKLEILTVTYYDNYNFKASWGSDYNYAPSKVQSVTVNGVMYSQPSSEFTSVTGHVTGTKVKIVDAIYGNNYQFLKSISYYDDKYRTVQSISENHQGGTDRTTTLYDFVGKALTTSTTHNQYSVQWKDIVGVVEQGERLIKTSLYNDWYTGGAASTEVLPAGTDGWLEFTVSETNTLRMVGLNNTNTQVHYNDMNYAFYLLTPTELRIFEEIAPVTILPIAVSPGDILRIERTGTTVKYYRNGTLLRTSPTASTTSLLADVSLNQSGSTVQDVRTSFSAKSNTIARSFDYDHAGRLLKTWHSVNGATPVLLAQNEYNEIGQLVDKKLYSTDNGSTFKQSTDYRYNIRGWLTSINNSQLVNDQSNDDTNASRDLFGMNLSYNDAVSGINNAPQFNGNISAIKWSNNLSLGTVKDVAYKYSYDTLNRIKSATYMTNPGTWIASQNFAENGFSYDLNGNIRKLTRTNANGNANPMDVLTYDYTGQGNKGNQLKSVTDGGDLLNGFADGNVGTDDYTYDINGNMTADKNKNITAITYNHLNLPQQVTKGTGEKIMYTYDAGGRKLKQQVFNASSVVTKTTDYAGEFIYQNDTLQFINHEEGRIVMKPLVSGETGVRPEYQYHLKDHLGNVRTTFTTVPVVDQPVATFETANQNTEQNQFLRYDDARVLNSTLFDHTHNGTTAYSERLSGSANEKTGIARSISVMPGDVINLEVYAKYVDASNSNNTAALTQLLAQIAAGTATAGTVIDGANYSTNGITPFPFAGLAGEGNSTGTGPKAFLNYLIFDRNFVFVNGGYVRMTTAAKEDGTNVPHERLAAQITITQPGYVYAYLSNEETTPKEIYFDDFTVQQIKSPVVQSEDFYPFGLTFNSYSRENSLLNKFQYNGKELQNDLSINWLDYGARMYMPEIGRWGVIDNMVEKMRRWSPYSYAFNNPIVYEDRDGNIPWPKIAGSNLITSHLQPSRTIDGTAKPHQGLDIGASSGSTYRAAAGGKVIATSGDGNYKDNPADGKSAPNAADGGGWGNYVVIDHGNGIVTLYAHMKEGSLSVKPGDEIKDGQSIGEVGNTGHSFGAHAHVEAIYNKDGSNKYSWDERKDKNAHVFSLEKINDLQDVVDGKEKPSVEMLNGSKETIDTKKGSDEKDNNLMAIYNALVNWLKSSVHE
ncbi:MAG: peptidoglycan DD-metalloendopeptidase family protein [Bacteroidetes bacterium]|nr:peptidoglycan DD-metalloendopeptidase family protein [Bacteroidota bacterium]